MKQDIPSATGAGASMVQMLSGCSAAVVAGEAGASAG